MVKETDSMQVSYHKKCRFCTEFCGNPWCPIYIKGMKEDAKVKEDHLDFGWLPSETSE